jgi:hypothetical protein
VRCLIGHTHNVALISHSRTQLLSPRRNYQSIPELLQRAARRSAAHHDMDGRSESAYYADTVEADFKLKGEDIIYKFAKSDDANTPNKYIYMRKQGCTQRTFGTKALVAKGDASPQNLMNALEVLLVLFKFTHRTKQPLYAFLPELPPMLGRLFPSEKVLRDIKAKSVHYATYLSVAESFAEAHEFDEFMAPLVPWVQKLPFFFLLMSSPWVLSESVLNAPLPQPTTMILTHHHSRSRLLNHHPQVGHPTLLQQLPRQQNQNPDNPTRILLHPIVHLTPSPWKEPLRLTKTAPTFPSPTTRILRWREGRIHHLWDENLPPHQCLPHSPRFQPPKRARNSMNPSRSSANPPPKSQAQRKISPPSQMRTPLPRRKLEPLEPPRRRKTKWPSPSQCCVTPKNVCRQPSLRAESSESNCDLPSHARL